MKVLATVLGNVLDSLDLESRTRQDTPNATSTRMHWETPSAGNDDGNVFEFTVLSTVEHEYPNGKNNPNHFVMADILWDFFSQHPMPGDTDPPQTTFKKKPDGRTKARTVTYKFKADDPAAT